MPHFKHIRYFHGHELKLEVKPSDNKQQLKVDKSVLLLFFTNRRTFLLIQDRKFINLLYFLLAKKEFFLQAS